MKSMNKPFWLKMLALFGAMSLVNPLVFAQDENEDDDEDRITVIGSRIKRNQVEGAQPVIVITNERIQERGYVTVFEALDDLSQNTGIQIEGPEFSNGFSPDAQVLDLRGLGVGRSLMLVNGKRLANYPAAYQSSTTISDFGAIPTAAVDRIEILTTGGSAIYGSDAIAGVVNVILKEDVDETTVNYIFGTSTEGGGDTHRLQFFTGKTFNRGNVTLALEYEDRDAITGADRDQYDSNLDYPFGTGVLDRWNLNLNQWDLLNARNDGGYVDPGADTCEAIGNGTVRAFRENRGWFCGFDNLANAITFRNERQKFSAFLHGRYELTDNLEAYADILYFDQDSRNNSNRVIIGDDILDTSTIVDTGFNFAFFDWIYFQRAFTSEEVGRDLSTTFGSEATAATLGLKGYWRDQEWDLSINNSTYDLNQSNPHPIYSKVIENFFGELSPVFGGFGFFGDEWYTGDGLYGLYDVIPQSVLQDMIGDQTYGNKTESLSANFLMTGDLMELDAGPLSYALSAEFERQEFSFQPDELIQQDPPVPGLTGSGWYKLTGFDGVGDRDRTSLGFELRAPFFEGEKLVFNLAGRWDGYDSTSSSIGTRFTPQLGVEWRPIDSLLVRGSYGESFRAPDLQQVFTETGFFTSAFDIVSCYEQYVFQNGNDDDFDRSTCQSVGVFAKRTPGIRLGPGETPLKDEVGDNLSIGVVWDVSDDLTLMADYSEIDLEDVVVTESLNGLLLEEFGCYIIANNLDRSLGTGIDFDNLDCPRNARRLDRQTEPTTGLSFIETFRATPVNIAEEFYRGIDLRAIYRAQTGWGDFRFDVDYTHVLDRTFRSDSDSPVFNRRDSYGFSGYGARSIVNAALTYSRDDFSTTLTLLRRGSTPKWNVTQDEIENGVGRLGPYIRWNWTGQYRFTDKFATRLRITNLFDQDPPTDDSFLFFEAPWYNNFAYGGAGIGREIALELEYTF